MKSGFVPDVTADVAAGIGDCERSAFASARLTADNGP